MIDYVIFFQIGIAGGFGQLNGKRAVVVEIPFKLDRGIPCNCTDNFKRAVKNAYQMNPPFLYPHIRTVKLNRNPKALV